MVRRRRGLPLALPWVLACRLAGWEESPVDHAGSQAMDDERGDTAGMVAGGEDRPRPRSYPASIIQESMWLACQMPGREISYNETEARG